LKEQLKQQLADVEKQHSAAEESLRPQTVAQVDALQKKLEAALEELKGRRTELEQKNK
jgi:phage shock protein A